MAVKLESGQHRVLGRHQPAAAHPKSLGKQHVDKLEQDLLKYQQRKRCNPREDFLFSSLGGLAMGGLGGFVLGAIPGLPLLLVGGLATGAAGAVAGAMAGSALGVVGGSAFAACHLHYHTPDAGNLSRHVFSRFHVVPLRHQSRRIQAKLLAHGVLFKDEARRVVSLEDRRIDAALDEVRVFGRPLSPKKREKIKRILHTQVHNVDASEAAQAKEVEASSMP